MSLFSPVVHFPFMRSQTFTIAELRNFERHLLIARKGNTVLSKAWRIPDTDELKQSVKMREETYPIKLLADYKSYPDDATFSLSPPGTPNVDAKINTPSEMFDLQITIADPIWTDDQGNTSNGGYDHRLLMEELNKSGFVHGSGLMRREGGKIISGLPMRSFEQEFAACRDGLTEALKRKLPKSVPGCRLLVYARGYSQRTMDFTFETIIREVIDAMQSDFKCAQFEKYYFADEGRGSFFEY